MTFSELLKILNIEVKTRKSGKTYSDCPLCKSKDKLSFSDQEDFFFCWGCRCRGNISKFQIIFFGEILY